MASSRPGAREEASSSIEAQSAYNDLKRLIPSLAAELELLRTSLREHSLWLLRYGHGTSVPGNPPDGRRGVAPSPQPQGSGRNMVTTASQDEAGAAASHEQSPTTGPSSSSPGGAASSQPPPSSAPSEPPPAFSESEPPAYSASDVPPYTGGFSTVSASTREEVQARRDQLTEWLREGEDVLREYSARYAQLAEELGLPQEDLLGTWHEAHPDNALPGYQQVERNEELMVGGVGEVPPPYLGGRPQGIGSRGRSQEPAAAGSSSKAAE
ncbi:hypothetical protein M406DRAFT_348874 [Cryphonectria parasitica EP155]|uniref:Uncharacterized protein n=1 Tax=Cryphonectria parasitica (strain ATCC 38755 / EP155) TaxID=660469 RepID=A0A9P4YA71_CRYP1|nr:uncharacterized protein M406DRAFT_348874 [Cryphonectria parasitica EP155]KAF3769777.1 hypothetical protein M406DRAFT_348874 [Cryphonectria parasitica EP155]